MTRHHPARNPEGPASTSDETKKQWSSPEIEELPVSETENGGFVNADGGGFSIS